MNDQVHKLIVSDLQEAVNETIGRGKLLHKRPVSVRERRLGGMYFTEAGVRRGPHQYHYAMACAHAWRAFPQITLTAAFIRLRFLSPQMAAKMMNCNAEEVNKGLVTLAQWQAAVAKTGRWLHPDQDFSGTPRAAMEPGHVVIDAVGLASRSLAQIKDKMVPATLSGLVATGMCETDAAFGKVLTEKRERAGSTLASLAVMPGPENVGEYAFFKQAILVPLSRSPYWLCCKRLTKEVKEDVLEWQHDYLKKKYFALVEARSSQVIRTHGGAERQISLHAFVWGALKAVHKKTNKDLDDLCRRMLGDVKKLALNPQLRHPKAKVAAKSDAKAAPTPVPNAEPKASPIAAAPAAAAVASPAAAAAAPAPPPDGAVPLPAAVSAKDFLAKAHAAAKAAPPAKKKGHSLKLPAVVYKHFPKSEPKKKEKNKTTKLGKDAGQ